MVFYTATENVAAIIFMEFGLNFYINKIRKPVILSLHLEVTWATSAAPCRPYPAPAPLANYLFHIA